MLVLALVGLLLVLDIAVIVLVLAIEVLVLVLSIAVLVLLLAMLVLQVKAITCCSKNVIVTPNHTCRKRKSLIIFS